MASWVAGQITDGSLDPAVGTHLIRADIAHNLGDPVELQPLVQELNREAVEAAKRFLGQGTTAEAGV
ncbi:hypothetical protein [Streptomyces xanthophaeus]